MATKKSTGTKPFAKNDAEKVALILNETTYVLNTIHELADAYLAGEGFDSPTDLCVAIKAMTKSAARSLDCCADKLGGEGTGMLDDGERLKEVADA